MYKMEDLKFLNMKIIKTMGKEIFSIERELNIEEKTKFIDDIENGVASYLIDIFTKWENEKESLPKDQWKDVKTVSKKAWIKRNDKRKIIKNEYKIGYYYLFGTEYKSMSLTCPTTEYGRNMTYTNDNVVNQWFHDLCDNLYKTEQNYFKTNNPIHIKITEIQQYANKYNIYFNSKKVNDVVWNDDENITEAELDIYLESYKKIETFINDITKEVENKINEFNK